MFTISGQEKFCMYNLRIGAKPPEKFLVYVVGLGDEASRENFGICEGGPGAKTPEFFLVYMGGSGVDPSRERFLVDMGGSGGEAPSRKFWCTWGVRGDEALRENFGIYEGDPGSKPPEKF